MIRSIQVFLQDQNTLSGSEGGGGRKHLCTCHHLPRGGGGGGYPGL